MNFKGVGWVLVLLVAALVSFLAATLAWIAGFAWVLGLLCLVWGVFLLAEFRRWIPLRDVAWAANVGFGISVVRWFDLPAEATSRTGTPGTAGRRRFVPGLLRVDLPRVAGLGGRQIPATSGAGASRRKAGKPRGLAPMGS